MNRVLDADKFAEMWKKSRHDAGKSQDYMAKALGVSKKTVQNWEDGTSCPSQLLGLQWFKALGLQPLPYYLNLLYPEFDDLSPDSSNEQCDKALFSIISSLTPTQRRKLLYILNADHGSSIEGILDMMTADLHCPLEKRVVIAHAVLTNYEIEVAKGNVGPHIKPDVEILRKSIYNATQAVIDNQKHYSN